MPCYEVRVTSVVFKVEHQDILEQAIKSLGLELNKRGVVWLVGSVYDPVVLDLKSGLATVSVGEEDRLNQLKVEYTKQTVRVACDQFNWALEFTDQAQTEGQFTKEVML